MSLALLMAIGGLTSVGLYLITARSLSRIILGFSLLGHAAVLALLAAGGPPGPSPIANQLDGQTSANPVPQALALTAIVISFGLTLFLLALGQQRNRKDHTVSGVNFSPCSRVTLGDHNSFLYGLVSKSSYA